MKLKLDQEISEKRNVETLQKYYIESLPLLQANFYSILMEGGIPEEKLTKYLSDYQLSFSGPFYCCLVIHTSSRQVPQDMNPLLLATSVQKQAEERLGEKWRAKCFVYLRNTILIAELENENQVSELTDECDKFCRYVHRMLGADVTVGIGHVCDNILDLSRSYSSARDALSYRVIYGTTRAINIKEIAPRKMGKLGLTNDVELSNLFKMIRVGSEEEVVEAVNRCLEQISLSSESLHHHHIAIMELVSALYRFSANHDVADEEFAEDAGKQYSMIVDMEPEELKTWLTNISLSFHEKLMNERSRSTKSFVNSAKEFVYNNYANQELSLDTVCEALGVSNSYFSTIFKKETGNSFIGYLTDYRMERASRLMIETNEKSYMIAKSVGYTDPNYFSYVFKRRFGVSPSKYRTEHVEGEK